MYDYATWNMYERIVNARRQRLSWLDAQQKMDKDGSEATSLTADNLSSGGESSMTSKVGMSGEFHKVHSREDSSLTSSTVDESDKSSSTLSSASSSTSTASILNGKGSKLSLGSAIKTIHQEAQGTDGGDDEHFIFEMDM